MSSRPSANFGIIEIVDGNFGIGKFFLVGGTALALQIGHRISVDIDLFTRTDFNPHKLSTELNRQFIVTNLAVEKDTLHANLAKNIGEPVKVDLIKYPYPLLTPILKIDSIRL